MAFPSQRTEEDIRLRSLVAYEDLYPQLLQVARVDPSAFCGFVLKDESTRKSIKQAPVHEAWHALLTQHPRVVVWSHVESGKTTNIAVGRTLWEIGKNPNLRAVVLSNTHGQAVKIVRSIARYVEQSEELREVFPKLKPSNSGWRPDSGSLTVHRKVISKDPTVQATGVHGNILGSRVDLAIVDDLLDYENTLSAPGRQALWDWFQATITGRMTANGRTAIVGTAHHPDDLMHRYARHPGWAAFRYPVVDEHGVPRWPERWPLARIEAARTGGMVPVEFARQLLCVARDDASSKIKQQWIDVALKRGEGKRIVTEMGGVPLGCKIYTGVDLAVQQHSGADLTVLFTVMIHPDGSREVLCIESGRWSGPDIVRRIFETHRRFMSILIVENNAAQDFIVQFASAQYALPIKPFTTGRNKAHPEFGVESIGAEMEQGKWIIPNEGGRLHPEVSAWVQEMLHYSPEAHTGDRLMASWFAREGARMVTPTAESGHINLLSR